MNTRVRKITKGELKLINYMMKRLIDVITADLPSKDKIEKLECLSYASGKLVDEINKGVLVEGEIDIETCEAITLTLADGYEEHQELYISSILTH